MPLKFGRNLPGKTRLDADLVVIGSGAGGAMAASEAASAGAKVVVLEEGPWLSLGEMSQREDAMLPLLYQERGARTTEDRAIRVLGGRTVGGSTVHNTNLCKRAPEEILALWAERHAVSGLGMRELSPVYESVERELSVSEIAAVDHNQNNQVLSRGLERLGWQGGSLRHNRVGCQKSGFCELGCPFDAKQNAAKILVPKALSHGATVISDARAGRILHDGRRVQGVLAHTLLPGGKAIGELTVSARAVVLAGSAIGSAVVAQQSGLPDPHTRLGLGLYLHPGVPVVGEFEQTIQGYKGIPQSVECSEFLRFTPGSDRRVWITTAFAHPVGASVMLPGFGAAHREWMLLYPKLAVLTAMVHDENWGRVSVGPRGRAKIQYRLGDSDRAQLELGVRACARLLLSAGARRVLIPSVPPLVLRSEQEVESVRGVVGPHRIPIAAVHPMGGLPLGDNPKSAVVNSRGEHHQVRGLFVADGSLFPTSLGVPPQLSIYTVSRYLAGFTLASLR